MGEFLHELKIPKNRIAVLIGKDGATKDFLEERAGIKLDIDSKEGEVIISGNDALKLYSAKEVVKAIGRGFNPDVAINLLNQDYAFELIDISEFVKGKQNHVIRIKGRIIGKEGKSREVIEELTQTTICVFGKTVGIVGAFDRVAIARRAIENLILGSPHSSVYKWLEKQRRQVDKQEFESKNDDFLKDEFKSKLDL